MGAEKIDVKAAMKAADLWLALKPVPAERRTPTPLIGQMTKDGQMSFRTGKAEHARASLYISGHWLHALAVLHAVAPEPRYAEAVYLHIDAFPWQPVEGSSVRVKHLATFSERNLTISVAEIPAGESFDAGSPLATTIGLVLSGTIESGGADCQKYSGLMAEEGDQIHVTGKDATNELIFIDLPVFD